MNDLTMVCKLMQIGIDASGAENFARSLVGALAGDCGVQAALLYELGDSGQLVLRDSYGFREDITQAFYSPSVFEDLPMGHAIRNAAVITINRAKVLETVSRVNEKDLLFDDYTHIPCRSLDAPLGGIALAFSGNDSVPELTESIHSCLGAIGAARLNLLRVAEKKVA